MEISIYTTFENDSYTPYEDKYHIKILFLNHDTSSITMAI